MKIIVNKNYVQDQSNLIVIDLEGMVIEITEEDIPVNKKYFTVEGIDESLVLIKNGIFQPVNGTTPMRQFAFDDVSL